MPLLHCGNATMHAICSDRRPARDPRLIEGVLANLTLMEGVSRQAVRRLSEQAVLLHAKRGGALVQRGERVAGLFAIAYGSVKQRLRHPGGDELVLALLGPGDTFAEVPALLAQTARVDAVALADSMLVVINPACIATQAQSDPRLARNMTHILARRMHALIVEVERGMLPSLQRLAVYLESIAEVGDVARLPGSKTLVASRLGIKKETLSRLLRQLTGRGLVTVGRREIRILDRAALAALAQR